MSQSRTYRSGRPNKDARLYLSKKVVTRLNCVLAFLIVLVPLILIHEFGHLIACKMVGITVLEFGLGFPPRIAKLFRWGETDFTLNWLLFGGFVIPYGEDFIKPQTDTELASMRQQVEARGIVNAKSVFSARPYEKFWFLFAGPLINFAAAYALFVVVALAGLPTSELPVPYSHITVVQIFENTAAAQAGLQYGDIITQWNNKKLDTSLALDKLSENPQPARLTVQRGNETIHLEIAPGTSGESIPQFQVVVGEVQKNTPAASAGFQEGDIFLTVNGEAITEGDQLIKLTQSNQDKPMAVTLLRDGKTVEVTVTPVRLVGEENARIGIRLSELPVYQAFGFVVNDIFPTVSYSVPEAFRYANTSFSRFMRLTAEFTVTLPSKLISGELDFQEARPVSPVGLSQIGAELIENYPYQDVIHFIAIVSIALGITNLLPIPGLDGGRILFVLIEMVRGKPVTPEREGMVHLIGIGLMFSLMIVLVINDIFNPVRFLQ